MLVTELGIAMTKDGLKMFDPISDSFIAIRHMSKIEQDKLLALAREKYPNTYPYLLKVVMNDEATE